MIDIHSHILPNVDDGAGSLEEGLRMAERAVNDGIREMVATPHSLDGVYVNCVDDILAGVAQFRCALSANHLDLELHPGGDVHLSTHMVQRIQTQEVCTLNNMGKFILLELPSQMIPNGVKDEIFSLKLNGITPIITHPERNLMVQHDPETLYELVEMGALAQVTAMSLTGDFGEVIFHVSERLMKHRLIHIIATDAHSAEDRPPVLSGAVERAADILKSYDEALHMVTQVPAAILSGRTPDVPEPMHVKRTGRTAA
ncbi:MAG: tyrosine protein phosphatase [Deltaproteobacteria bacterium]|nr:tyrosine protein phosphatase [Deltaproteobacteria bacterium]